MIDYSSSVNWISPKTLSLFSLDTLRTEFTSLIAKSTRPGQPIQHARKVVSDNLRLVDFAIGLVNSVFIFPDGQVMFSEEFK